MIDITNTVRIPFQEGISSWSLHITKVEGGLLLGLHWRTSKEATHSTVITQEEWDAIKESLQ